MRRLPVLLSIAAVCAVGARAQAPQVARIVLEGTAGEYARFGSLTISPDGRQVAYMAGNDGSEADSADYQYPEYIWLKNISGGPAVRVPIAGLRPEFARVTFSPDGKAFLFFSGEDLTLRRVPVTGGASTVVCKAPGVTGVSWGLDDRIVFSQGQTYQQSGAAGTSSGRLVATNGSIKRVAAAGGSPETLVTLNADETAFDPEVLPESNAILFSVVTRPSGQRAVLQIVAQPLTRGDRKVIVSAGGNAHYVSTTGQLVYTVDDKLFTAPFDPKELQTTGPAVALAEDVRAGFAISGEGTLVYVTPRDNRLQVSLVSRDGTKKPIGFLPPKAEAPRVSPDATQVAFDDGSGIWIANLDNLASMWPLTSSGSDSAPVWTPDGRRITYASFVPDDVESIGGIYWRRADGSDQPELLVRRASVPEFWSRQTGRLSFVRWLGESPSLWTYSPNDRTSRLVLNVMGEAASALSPDGKWLAFEWARSDRSYRAHTHVYVSRFPSGGTPAPVTNAEGYRPMWSADGRELFFENRRQLFVMRSHPGPQDGSLTFEDPVALPITGFEQGWERPRRQYDMMPNGDAFLMLFRMPLELAVVPNALPKRAPR